MIISTKFEPGQIVAHITDSAARGVIVAFMVRGMNHSYQIQWGIERLEWHLDFELMPVEAPLVPFIGFRNDS